VPWYLPKSCLFSALFSMLSCFCWHKIVWYKVEIFLLCCRLKCGTLQVLLRLDRNFCPWNQIIAWTGLALLLPTIWTQSMTLSWHPKFVLNLKLIYSLQEVIKDLYECGILQIIFCQLNVIISSNCLWTSVCLSSSTWIGSSSVK